MASLEKDNVDFCEHHWKPLLAALVLGGLGFAYSLRFVQDDAFISFRYAEHLAHGHQLTWNIGEPPVEGFTNLFFVLLLAAVIRLGGDPVTASMAIGLGSFLMTLLLTFSLASAIIESRRHALICVLLVATNASFAAYATGGLETQLVTFTILLAIGCACAPGPRTTKRAIAFAVASTLSVWTRLDATLALAPFGILLAQQFVREKGWRQLAALVGVSGAGLALLLGFKIRVFGNILPVTYFAKASDAGLVLFLRGLEYVVAFFSHYGLFLPLALAAVGLARARVDTRSRAHLFAILAALALWCAYVCKVGGDFMEFRFLVPIFPLMVVFIIWGVRELRVPQLPMLVAGELIVSSFVYLYNTYDESVLMEGTSIETIHGLRMHLEAPQENWVGIGRFLQSKFHDSEVTISLGPAGAIPYYSGLRTIDIFGLGDPWVARHGVRNGSRVGHMRIAPLSYLQHSGVTLALWWLPLPGEKPPEGTIWVDLPVGDGLEIHALYLTKNAAVDRLIVREGWKTRPAI